MPYYSNWEDELTAAFEDEGYDIEAPSYSTVLWTQDMTDDGELYGDFIECGRSGPESLYDAIDWIRTFGDYSELSFLELEGRTAHIDFMGKNRTGIFYITYN